MSQLARQVVSKYFGFGSSGEVAIPQMGGIGSELSNLTQQVAANIGVWEPSEQGVMDLAREASSLEAQTVIAKEYSHQLNRYNTALTGYKRVVSGHVLNASRQSLQLAQDQDRFYQQILPTAVKMGATLNSAEGRFNAVTSSRLKAFGAR